MTTNGVLLDKYISFFVENNFLIKISIDGGTEKNNSYRKFHDGSIAFNSIFKNILYIKEKYPIFFEKNVDFMSVLHDRNPEFEISDFFTSVFNKKLNASMLATDSLDPENEKDFWKMYPTGQNINSEENNTFKKEQINYDFDNLIRFVQNYSGYTISNYSDLLTNNQYDTYQPTATCQPFSRMIFITAGGKILPCERIGHQHTLGSVTEFNVNIDFDNIATIFNNYFNNIKNMCCECIHELNCKECLLQTEIVNTKFKCRQFLKNVNFKRDKHFSDYFALIEKNPELYLLTTKYKFI